MIVSARGTGKVGQKKEIRMGGGEKVVKVENEEGGEKDSGGKGKRRRRRQGWGRGGIAKT